MRVKSCLLASAMVLGITLSAMHHTPAYAADGAREAAPMVLAQNNDNRGFFNKLFNRKGESGSARPVYMDKGSSKTTPYDFSRNRKTVDQRRRSTGDVSWEAFNDRRKQRAMEVAAAADASANAAVARIDRKLAAKRAAKARGQGQTGAKERKRMIYDPEKVWTYNPGERRSTGSQPRLYNPY